MAIESYLYPYKLHTLPSGVSQTGISPPPSSRLRTASNVTWAEGKSWKCWGVFWMSGSLFFFGVGQTLKRILIRSELWLQAIFGHVSVSFFKKSLEILYFTSESTTSKLHPAHHWWFFAGDEFSTRRANNFLPCDVFSILTFLCNESTKMGKVKPSGHPASTGPNHGTSGIVL